MSELIECPYCGHEQNVDHSCDGDVGWDDDEQFEQECEKCGKTFLCTTSVSYDYETRKADCLNYGKHKWKLTDTHPTCCSKMECQECGETRSLTEDERKNFGIGSVKDYFDELDKEWKDKNI